MRHKTIGWLWCLFVCMSGSVLGSELVLRDTLSDAELQARIPRPMMHGIVRDPNGQRLAGVGFRFMPIGHRAVTSDVVGCFALDWRPGQFPGMDMAALLVAQHPARNLALAQPLDRDTTTLDLTLEPGSTISGQVVDANGNPLSQGAVELRLHYDRYIATFDRASCGQSGHFKMAAIPRGCEFTLLASAIGYGVLELPFFTDEFESEIKDFGSLSLVMPTLPLSGRVVDINDKPLAGVRLRASGLGQPTNLSAQTEANGTFSFDKVCPGSIQIIASMSRGRRMSASIEAEGGRADLKIVMQDQTRLPPLAPTDRLEPKPLLGQPLPDLTRAGVETDTPDFAGKPLLLCFWDVQQRPARHCLLQLKKQARVLEEQGIKVVAVQSTDVPQATLDTWLADNDIAFTTGDVKQSSPATLFRWGVRATPWLILTDREHKVKAEGFTVKELEAKLALLD
ncbi:carboxypeptidase regulatory-like domain-containing protein [Planctomycetota bacterium]